MYGRALAFAASYCVGLGACYQLGYWDTLEVQVLQFVGLPDLAKLALPAALIGTGVGLIASIIGAILGSSLQPGGGGDTAIRRTFWRNYRYFAAGLLAAGVLVGAFAPEPNNWRVAGVLIGFACLWFVDCRVLARIIPHRGIRSVAWLFFVTAPFLTVSQGKQAALQIVEGRRAETIDVGRSKLPITSNPQSPVLYLGLLGDTYVLREVSTGQTIYMKRPETPLFVKARAKY